MFFDAKKFEEYLVNKDLSNGGTEVDYERLVSQIQKYAQLSKIKTPKQCKRKFNEEMKNSLKEEDR